MEHKRKKIRQLQRQVHQGMVSPSVVYSVVCLFRICDSVFVCYSNDHYQPEEVGCQLTFANNYDL